MVHIAANYDDQSFLLLHSSVVNDSLFQRIGDQSEDLLILVQ